MTTAEGFSARYDLREQQVVGYAINGEILESGVLGGIAGRSESNTVARWPINPVEIGNSELGALGRHSQQLHLAALESGALRAASVAVPQLLRYVADEGLYARALRVGQPEKDFLQRLLEYQFGVFAGGATVVAPNNLLERFGLDAIRLARSGFMQEVAVRSLLIASVIEHYNFVASGDTAPFVEEVTGGVRLNYGRVNLAATASLKGLERLSEYLKDVPFFELDYRPDDPGLMNRRAWYFQGGESPLNATASGTASVGMLGFTGADTLIGAGGDDVLLGAQGNDILAGGTGTDILIGGDDFDTYVFFPGDGTDYVRDRDLSGRIIVGGTELTGTAGSIGALFAVLPDGRSRWTLGDIVYTLVPGWDNPSTVLEITSSAWATGDRIVINNFDLGIARGTGVLGIKLKVEDAIGLKAGVSVNRFQSAGGPSAPAMLAPGAGGAQTATIDLNAPARAGDKILLSQAGLAGDPSIVTGAEVLSLASGAVELTLAEGQTQVSFALWARGTVASNHAGTLSATLVRANPDPDQVGPIQTSATVTLTANAASDTPPTTTYTITGDQVGISGDGHTIDAYGNVVNGTASPNRNDSLNGSPGNDLINALGGDDFAAGHGGDDHLLGGTGDDRLFGGIGNDRLEGQEGRDQLFAGTGDDLVIGGAGDDFFLGGDAGNDRVYANALTDEASIFASDTVTATLGSEWLDGGEGNDRLYAGTGADVLLGGAGEDLLAGGAGADTLYGDRDVSITVNGSTNTYTVGDINATGGADFLHGGGGDDFLYGEVGADTLLGAGGNDELHGDSPTTPEALHGGDFLDGGEGDDRLFGQGGNDALFGGAGNDFLQGDDPGHAPGDDYLAGEDGNDTLIGGGGKDVLYGGAGNDELHGDGANVPIAQQADDSLYGGDGADTLHGYGGDDLLDGGAGDDTVLGGLGKDRILGGEGNDILSGDEGAANANAGDADTIDGGAGDDQIFGQGGDDVLLGGAGTDTILGGAGNDRIEGGEGNDVAFGEAGDDRLLGGAGNDQLNGGLGADVLEGGAGDDFMLGGEGNDTLKGEAGVDRLQGGTGNDTASGGEGNDLLFGEDGDDSLAGDAGNDELQGNAGDDRLEGGDGDDLLIGGTGTDILIGGLGNDHYIYNAGDGQDALVDSSAGGEVNTLQMSFAFGPGVVFLSVGSLKLDFGNGDEIHIEGFNPDDPYADPAISQFVFSNVSFSYEQLLDTLGFTLAGTPEADVIEGTVLDDSIDALASDDIVVAKAGNDTVDAGPGDDLVLGGEGNDHLLGGEGDDLLYGDEGDDRLEGGAGADFLAGGAGNDTYVVSDTLDAIEEFAGEGTDTVETSVTLTLADNLENLTLAGSANLSGTGNAGANLIRGNAGDNVLAGLEGNDTLRSEGGADTLDGGAGDDTLIHSGAGGLEQSNLPGVLLGGAGNDMLHGGIANDYLDGGTGIDLMIGNDGDDTYIVDATSDVVREQDLWDRNPFTGVVTIDAQGVDAVHASASFALPHFVESLTLTGTAAISGTGTVMRETLTGNEAPNVLAAYALNGLVTNVIPAGLGGTTQYSASLPDGVAERLWDRLVHEYWLGTYNEAEIASSGTLEVNARAGDTLTGNGGDDTLIGAWDDDRLEGGAGNDLLIGSGGADVMIGGAGNDRYVLDWDFDYTFSGIRYVDLGEDTIIELPGGGTDTVYSNAEEVVLGANVENAILLDFSNLAALGLDYASGILSSTSTRAQNATGNELANILTGNVTDNDLYGGGGNDTLFGGRSDDRLDGGTGADRMEGGSGDDTYVVDNVGDLVIEASNGYSVTDDDWQGLADKVEASISYTLPVFIEDLELTGSANLSGTGNSLDNEITGNDGANVLHGLAGDDELDGGSGADQMFGGTGDDVYKVDHSGDRADETGGDGYDIVESEVTFTLGAGLEELRLEGDRRIDGTGNALDNVIIGNDEDNVLTGLAGDDELVGGDGDDTLFGGAGADTLRGGEGNDLLVGGADDDQYEVDGNDDTIIELAGEGIDEVESSGSFELPDHVENLEVVAEFDNNYRIGDLVGSVWATGNDQDNRIRGGDVDGRIEGRGGDDHLDGEGGNDLILGGAGNDTLFGGNDVIYEGAAHVCIPDGNEDDTCDREEEEGGGSSIEVLASNDDELFGGDGDDTLDGGSGNDLLDGGAGDDVLFGGADGRQTDDGERYFRDDEGRFIVVKEGFVELFGSTLRIDGEFVTSGVTELAAPPDGLFLSNDDVLRGGDGNDMLDGGSGDDLLFGGSGDDTLYGGDDGNRNTSNDDLLDGGAGVDLLIGGTGDDVYYTDGTLSLIPDWQANDNLCAADFGLDAGARLSGTSDTVIEISGEGYDVVYAAGILTGAAHVEEIHLLGTEDLHVQAGEGDQRIIGNAGANLLDGGAGADILLGGAGDDTYYVDDPGDTVLENAGEGADWVRTTLAGYRLGAHLENVGLSVGAGAAEVFGNDAANVVVGNAFDNTLHGEAGDDTLAGREGNDRLLGGLGNDIYVFGAGWGDDTIADAGGALDVLHLQDGIAPGSTSFGRDGDDLLLDFGTAGDSVRMVDWFSDGARIEFVRFCDGTEITATELLGRFDNQAPLAVDDVAAVREDLVLLATGNVVANDSDDGTTLTVSNAGTTVGASGTLTLAPNGDFSYLLDNASVQSLAEGEVIVDAFGYTVVDDNTANPKSASATLTVSITGTNDAPVLAQAFLAQHAVEGEAFAYGFGTGQFVDVDQGDTLGYAASLADGAPLPTWLSFDASTRAFSGVPTAADIGHLDVRVSATDAFGAAASGVFSVAVQCAGVNHIVGTVHDDSLIGTDCADRIEARNGKDRLEGRGGNDFLIGGNAKDVLLGGAGNDLLCGGNSPDLLEGGAGSNVFIGGKGADSIVATGTNDVVAWNRGDGPDEVTLGASGLQNRLTLSFGGGVRLRDIGFERRGTCLIVDAGGDAITITNWYALALAERPALTVQLIDRDVRHFEVATAVNPLQDRRRTSDHWQGSGAPSVDGASGAPLVIGGEIAAQYATGGCGDTCEALTDATVFGTLGSEGFGSPQAISSLRSPGRHDDDEDDDGHHGSGDHHGPRPLNGGRDDDRRGGREGDERGREGEQGRRAIDDWFSRERGARAQFDFERYDASRGAPSSRDDIAQSWSRVARFAAQLGDEDANDARRGALTRWHPLSRAAADAWGFAGGNGHQGGVGGLRGAEDLKRFEGLNDGFRPL